MNTFSAFLSLCFFCHSSTACENKVSRIILVWKFYHVRVVANLTETNLFLKLCYRRNTLTVINPMICKRKTKNEKRKNRRNVGEGKVTGKKKKIGQEIRGG